MTVVTLPGTTHAVAPASTQAGSDPSRMVALALLSVRRLPPSMIANEFAYNRFVPGPFGLSAKMGAEATITLPGMATAGPDVPGKAATLRLRTVNGTSFDLSMKAS